VRFLILNTDYPEFLRWLYAQHERLDRQPYPEQVRVRMDSLFGTADFYSRNLRNLGHEAWDIQFNNEPMQRAWADEQGIALPAPRRSLQFRPRRGGVPWPTVAPDPTWMRVALAAQIQQYRPEVILNLDVRLIDPPFLKEANASVRLVIGQHAAPLSKRVNLRGYDLMLSSLPNYVERFRREGLNAELHRLAFEPRVLERLGPVSQPIDVSFVGTLSPDHRSRVDLLEYLCRHTALRVWGPGADRIGEPSPIRTRHQGPAWGRDMYRVLRDSRITVNHHIDVAGAYANNLRLYEATGVGTLLVTDAKENLPQLFEPGREVVVYRGPVECAELIEYYLSHEPDRAAIARAGQQRTLREHTYQHRTEELIGIISKYA
jgi:spore maturation protein CgeB